MLLARARAAGAQCSASHPPRRWRGGADLITHPPRRWRSGADFSRPPLREERVAQPVRAHPRAVARAAGGGGHGTRHDAGTRGPRRALLTPQE